jgi:hypothetical protein
MKIGSPSFCTADLDLGHGVVPVRMLADTVVVQQTVAVAELNLLGD